MAESLHEPTHWWLATLGRTIVWARLRVREAGTAEVFDSDGNTLARMFLFFSSRFGCLGSLLVSAALSALLYFVFMRGGCGGGVTGSGY